MKPRTFYGHTTLLLAFVMVLGLTAQAFARPVSYPGGVTLMQRNDANTNALHMHYSPTARYSVGYLGEYFRESDMQFHGMQANMLLKRWNQKYSQANIYLKSGIGAAFGDTPNQSNESEAAAFTGIAADWENQDYFISYENRAFHAGDIENFFMQKTRIGITPYIGDYGDLHTWLMLQAEHMPEADDKIRVTPLVRLFKGPYMVEVGYSDDKSWLGNLIMRY